MDYSQEEWEDADRTANVVCKKLLGIMELQADVDTLLRGKQQTPFGAEKWRNSRPEALQRRVAMTAIQFLLFEPDDWVEGNDKLSTVADEILTVISGQLKWLKTKYPPE